VINITKAVFGFRFSVFSDGGELIRGIYLKAQPGKRMSLGINNSVKKPASGNILPEAGGACCRIPDPEGSGSKDSV
jgi:hypothetical protein